MYHTIYSVEPENMTPEHLGGKGYGLCWMTSKGINVPPALIFPTTICAEYRKSPKATMKKIKDEMANVFEFFTEKFGYMPLLSVRSGARASMPGMMDTILNVGLTEANSMEWEKRLGTDCVTNCAERLTDMHCSTVLSLPKELAVDDLVPQDATEQVLNCIEAVFKSWDNDRAKFYRKMNNIPEDWGTAVTVQAMVFGNLNENSGTGVLFTRNPDSGENVITGEFLANAQGEDVVAGTATPLPLSQLTLWNKKVSAELLETVAKLEYLKSEVQDVEFTIQDGQLYILQTRNAKRSAKAAVKIAMDMVSEEMITPAEAFKRISRREYDLSQLAVIDPSYTTEPNFTGIPACGGVVTGIVMLSAEAAINCKVPCILVTQETTPDDIEGMHAAKAVLTMTGGATSHAAVVARSMNKPCVVGLSVDLSESFSEGSTISICGSTGRVWKSEVPVIDGSDDPAPTKLRELMWSTVDAKPINQGSTRFVAMAEHYLKPLDEQVALVLNHLNNCDALVLDTQMRFDPNEDPFFNQFFMDGEVSPEWKLLDFLKGCDFDESKLMVMTECGTPFEKIPVVNELKDLLFAEGDCVVTIEMDKYAMRILELTQAQIKPIAIGTYTPGVRCFISESELVVNLLQ